MKTDFWKTKPLAAMSPADPTVTTSVPASLTPASLTSAEQAQRDELVAALRESGGNKSAVARRLGVTRVTVLNRMRKYGIDLRQVLVTPDAT